MALWIEVNIGTISINSRKVITWTNADLLPIVPIRTNFRKFWWKYKSFVILENAVENVVSKLSAILFQPPYVNPCVFWVSLVVIR